LLLPLPARAQVPHEIAIPEHLSLAFGSVQTLCAERSAADEFRKNAIDIALRHAIVLLARLRPGVQQGFAQLARVDLPAVVDVKSCECREQFFRRGELGQRR
jgi:hypothetical protein